MDHCSAPLSPRTPQPDPTGIPIGPLFTSDYLLFSRLVLLASLLELAARVAMVAARAWIAMGIRCCSRAMYLSLAIDTFASEERLDISFISSAGGSRDRHSSRLLDGRRGRV